MMILSVYTSCKIGGINQLSEGTYCFLIFAVLINVSEEPSAS